MVFTALVLGARGVPLLIFVTVTDDRRSAPASSLVCLKNVDRRHFVVT